MTGVTLANRFTYRSKVKNLVFNHRLCLEFHAGTVFDVTHKSDVYGPGKSYNIFAGKDGSKGLGMSSLKTEDAVPDYSTLEEKDRKTLDDWHAFFE
jgi:hypothetical protein